MANDTRPPRLAVLIDADNASSRIAPGLFEEIAKIGEASVRRIYGDFSSPRLNAWRESIRKHAINPHQQFACAHHAAGHKSWRHFDNSPLNFRHQHGGHLGGYRALSTDPECHRRLAKRHRIYHQRRRQTDLLLRALPTSNQSSSNEAAQQQ